jgi:hypothetical protein
LDIHLVESAHAARRTDTYLGARYRRLRIRRGPSKAPKVIAHSILVPVYHMLSRDVAYIELGVD